MAKLKRAEIAQLKDVQQAFAAIADLAEAGKLKAKEVQDSADAQIEEHRAIMQKHLDRKDLRPHVLFKPHPKNVWSVSYNSETYRLGPYDPIPIDDDEPRFWWQRPNEDTLRPVRSMFQALIAVDQDYHNSDEETDTGPVAS